MNYPIYCINLKERLDRRKNVKQEFNKIDIQPSNVIFLDFHLHKKGGRYGCYDSHMKVWNDFYTNHPDKEMCIIFEDDFEVTENSKLYLKKAISFIEKNKDKVDILFLHDNFIKYSENKNKDKNKNYIINKYFINGYGFLTHVYIVTRKYIKLILDKNENHLPKPNGIHFDIDINFNQKSILYSEDIYYCKKSVFIQNNLFESDNDDRILKRIYGINFTNNIFMNLKKKIKLLSLNDDDKTKKIYMILTKMYFKIK